MAIRDDVLYQELNEILNVQYHKSFNRHIEGTIEMDETSTQIHVQTKLQDVLYQRKHKYENKHEDKI